MTGAAVVVSVVLTVVVGRPWHRGSSRRRRVRVPRGSLRRSVVVDPGSARHMALALALALGFVVGGPVLAVVGAGAAALSRPVIERLRARRQQAAIAAAVPDLVDLFLVSASSGQTVTGSLAAVAPRAPPALASAVGGASDRFRRGLPLVECLAELGSDLGPHGAPLADSLRQAASAGAPLVPLLEGVAATARDRRRRRAQEVARRLPITMLFPMVACILPAAILLAVVPVLLVSVASLSP
jgi:tight adherence protein C